MALVIMLAIAAMLSVLCKKQIEETFSLSIFVIMSLLYLSGLFVSFIPGIVLVCMISLGSLIYLGHKLLVDRGQVSKYIFTVGGIVYIILAIYFFDVAYGRSFNLVSDEPHYWAAALKYYYSVSGLSDIPYSYSTVFYHGPVTLLWEYFCTRLWVRFSSGFAIWGQDLFLISLVVPIFANFKSGRDFKRVFVTSLLVILIPTYDATIGYTTIMADVDLFLLFSYSVIAIDKYLTKKSSFYYFQLIFAGCILVLTKRIGIVLVFLLMFIFAVMLKHSDTSKLQKYKCVCMYAVICLFAYASWQVYLSITYNRNNGLLSYLRLFTSLLYERPVALVGVIIAIVLFAALLGKSIKKIEITQIAYFVAALILFIFVLAMCLSDTEVLVKRNAIKYVVESLIGYEDIVLVGHVIKVIPGIFIIAICGIWYLITAKMDAQQMGFYRSLIVAVMISYAIYQMISLTSYILSPRGYDEYFAIDYRYIYPYYIAMMIVTLYFVTKHMDNLVFDKKIEIALLIFSLLFFDCGSVVTNLFDKKEEHHFYGLDDYTFNYTDKVFFVDWNYDSRDLTYEFLYQIFPARCNYHKRMYWSEYDGDTIETIENYLASERYNYIYLEAVGSEFKQSYSDMFYAGEIYDNHLYSVIHTDQGMKFQLVN